MTRKHKVRLASGLAAVALQFLLAGTASAHYPIISAVAICDENNDVVIEYTATAWPSARAIKRTNPPGPM